jgi:hypothetical protein
MLDRQLVFTQLVEIACIRDTISYYELAALFGLDFHKAADRVELSNVLNEISIQEDSLGRPLLSAVVVHPETGYPSQGFFLLARELTYNHFDDERSYYYRELKRVHDFWESNIPAALTFPFILVGDRQLLNSNP